MADDKSLGLHSFLAIVDIHYYFVVLVSAVIYYFLMYCVRQPVDDNHRPTVDASEEPYTKAIQHFQTIGEAVVLFRSVSMQLVNLLVSLTLAL